MEKFLGKTQVTQYREKFGDLPNLEHLEDPAKAINVILGKPPFISEENMQDLNRYFSIADDIEYVNWYDYPKAEQTGSRTSYVFSSISEERKATKGCSVCSAIILLADDEGNGKPLSLLTHQQPDHVLNFSRKKFKEDLKLQIAFFKKIAKNGTIDAIVAGGKFSKETMYFYPEYVQTIKRISEILTEELGFSPRVALGPSGEGRESIDVVVDTPNRDVYVIGDASKNEPGRDSSFQWFNVEELAEEWKKGNIK